VTRPTRDISRAIMGLKNTRNSATTHTETQKHGNTDLLFS
jgi:hypothetical protein